MIIAYIEITAACNFRCTFCPLVSMKRPPSTMPSEMVLDILEQIRRDRLADAVSFHLMGEPMLHKDVFRFCRVATEGGLKVGLVTNGSRLSEAANRALLDTSLDKVSISLRSSNDDYYSEIQKSITKLDYEAYLQNIRCLIEQSHRRGPDSPTTIAVRVFQKQLSDVLREKVAHQDSLYDTDAIIANLKHWGKEICGLSPEVLRKKYPGRFAKKRYIPITPKAYIDAH